MCVCCAKYLTLDFRLIFRLKRPTVESRKMTVLSLRKHSICAACWPSTKGNREEEPWGMKRTDTDGVWEALEITSLLDRAKLWSLRLGSLLLISPLSRRPECQLGRKRSQVFHLVLWNVLILWRWPESWCPACKCPGFLNSFSDKAE